MGHKGVFTFSTSILQITPKDIEQIATEELGEDAVKTAKEVVEFVKLAKAGTGRHLEPICWRLHARHGQQIVNQVVAAVETKSLRR